MDGARSAGRELSICGEMAGDPLHTALLLGLGLIFLTGFAYPEVIHNAAHDTRHSMVFPCH